MLPDIREFVRPAGMMETRYVRLLSSLCAQTYIMHKLTVSACATVEMPDFCPSPFPLHGAGLFLTVQLSLSHRAMPLHCRLNVWSIRPTVSRQLCTDGRALHCCSLGRCSGGSG